MLRFIPRMDAQGAAPLMQAGIPEPLALLMVQRGVRTPEAARAFLAPHPDQLLDPMRLRDMDRAASALRQAIERRERITIYGDYDVDGVTATALLHETLEACGARVAYYIPSRHEEGYGLNREALDRLAGTTDLLVTVDCGITAIEEVAYAYALGMRVIVTDHHEAPERLPACEAVVNPLLGDYPFPRLCGAGVAFKLAQALRGWQAVQALLPLVALATVADLVPLLEENRVLTALGLAALQTDGRPGLRALIEVAGLEGKPITAGHLGFQIGPRLNAGGRLKHA
nr:DHH family phosphoesterase [Clostridia bacterium]